MSLGVPLGTSNKIYVSWKVASFTCEVNCLKQRYLRLGYFKTTAFDKNYKKPPTLWQMSNKCH